ncbi:BMC domain protein [Pseudoflavonifractor capillosus ATCC 29799]|uniref:BMC domain protein n=2 Tax=Pseudoflavonifractor capillosus TaxID=106588 RepID=A6NTL2_9FIRM|nr:BMC domain protein [Pseudoflavonifractor capillosus ATCC 29799]
MATRLIPNVSPDMAKELNLQPHEKSLAIITADCDDVTYTALDEATKKADCRVAYAKSFYAGAANANTALAGEVIGILAAPNPAEARAGLEACVDVIENVAHFISANDDDSVCYYAHCISRTGSYLSEGAGINEGEALAYLIAPPLEAMYGVDAALKAADVRMCVLYAPPSETNFGGALLTGSQSACKSACDAFAAAVESVADQPKI